MCSFIHGTIYTVCVWVFWSTFTLHENLEMEVIIRSKITRWHQRTCLSHPDFVTGCLSTGCRHGNESCSSRSQNRMKIWFTPIRSGFLLIFPRSLKIFFRSKNQFQFQSDVTIQLFNLRWGCGGDRITKCKTTMLTIVALTSIPSIIYLAVFRGL